MALVERIANGKMSVLHVNSDGIDFYRGEIHMIKVIGDHPGISSSGIAHHFGITRGVVHKTLLKLEEKECVRKQPDPENASKHQLFLTSKGEAAYEAHEEYHNQHDSKLYAFLQSLNDDEAKAIQDFLNHARSMVEKHF